MFIHARFSSIHPYPVALETVTRAAEEVLCVQ